MSATLIGTTGNWGIDDDEAGLIIASLDFDYQSKEKEVLNKTGEVQGLVTLDDIMEEIIGGFTTSMPGAAHAESFAWDQNGECLLEGSATLRDINKQLQLDFPLDGPKTLNGLILEVLEDIPEAGTSLKIGHCVMEIVQVQNQAIKVVKLILHRPDESDGMPP